ncbi:MAG: cation-translocating P-type ATPase [Terrimonas ferruginea]|nr:cation-translocating P-type ATPase [Terrimonas ferruginea]
MAPPAGRAHPDFSGTFSHLSLVSFLHFLHMNKWYQLSAEDALKETGASAGGLSAAEAGKRLAADGPNQIEGTRKRSPVIMFLRQFADLMIIILMGAAVLSGVLGDLTDTIIIVVIVFLNAIVGFVQEYRAEKAMEALKNMTVATVKVLRDGNTASIPSAEIVRGDIIVLEAGDMVPADLRIIELSHLQINESALTGESVAVDKDMKPIDENDPAQGDILNMAFKGTFVTNGRGKGVVVATGMNTELGRIASLLQEPGTQTPLQKRLAAFSRTLAWVVLGICVIVFLIGYLRGEDPVVMLLTALSLAVAAMPEALPAVITISLALGARKMVRKNALIRKLPAVETLGSITYICTDKTGTLTLNQMTVEAVAGKNFLLDEKNTAETDEEDFQWLMKGMALNNDVTKNEKDESVGDPTETALFNYAADKGFKKDELEQQHPRVAEIPFDSERKLMSTIHQDGDGYFVIVKGAMEILLEKSDNEEKEKWSELLEEMLANGRRVIGFGIRTLDSKPDDPQPDSIEQSIRITGMAGLMDPPREEAKQAVKECRSAGITPVMITGDHPVTAATIAGRLGIITGKEDRTLTGKDLAELSDEQLDETVLQVRVYARVSPEQKLRIIRALQKKEQYVAMTGDGVNDAPALKHADIGVAMGISGTDVSKEAAHMILLDDNFGTIVGAVKEGRRIFDNIRKFIRYILTGNSAEIWTIFLAPLFGLPVPLLPIHILWINLVTDGLPGLALAAEKAERQIMQRPPRNPGESIFAGGLGVHVLWAGLFLAGITLVTQAWSINVGDAHWQTMVFTVLCFGQLFHVMAIRSEYNSLFSIGILSNKPMLWSIAGTFALQLGIIYLPFFNKIFHTQPLTWQELLICTGAATLIFWAVELEKLIRRRNAAKL